MGPRGEETLEVPHAFSDHAFKLSSCTLDVGSGTTSNAAGEVSTRASRHYHSKPGLSLRQELTESSSQTAREASQGDIQAKNLRAREAAAQSHGS